MTNILFSSTSSFEAAINAAVIASLQADIIADERKATLATWWKAGDVHGASEAYVSDYAARNGFEVHILNTEESNEGGDAIDVVFYVVKAGQLQDEREQVFTVWLEDMGNGAFVYGEW